MDNRQWTMDDALLAPPWRRAGWLEETGGWIAGQLARLGEGTVAPIEMLRQSATSCVLKVTSERGVRFFKTTSADTGYEARLTIALARRWPGQMPTVLATDEERNWLLLGDLGPTLREGMAGLLDLDRSAAMLRQYARLQRESASAHEALLAAGLPDRGLARLPSLYTAALADTRGLLLDHPEGITADSYQQLQDFAPQVQALCERLAAYGLPETLHHDDFHGGNIALSETGYVFFDWGEAALTHPLCSLLIVQRSAKYQLNADDAALDQLRDAYLGAWSDLLPLDELRAAWPLARHLGALHRALTWHRAAAAAPPAEREELAEAASYWFMTFVANDLP